MKRVIILCILLTTGLSSLIFIAIKQKRNKGAPHLQSVVELGGDISRNLHRVGMSATRLTTEEERAQGKRWIPACAGMTEGGAGMTEEDAGSTEEDAGMTEEDAGSTEGVEEGARWARKSRGGNPKPPRPVSAQRGYYILRCRGI